MTEVPKIVTSILSHVPNSFSWGLIKKWQLFYVHQREQIYTSTYSLFEVYF